MVEVKSQSRNFLWASGHVIATCERRKPEKQQIKQPNKENEKQKHKKHMLH